MCNLSIVWVSLRSQWQHLQRKVVLHWLYLQMEVAAQLAFSNLQHHSINAAEAVFRTSQSISTHF